MNKIGNISAEEEALRMAYTDLIAFGKLFLPGDFKRSKTPFFHYEIGDAYLDDSIFNLAVIIARGHAKCLKRGQKVMLSNGLEKPVEKVVAGDRVVSLNEKSLKTEEDIIAHKFENEIQPVYKITTRSGRELYASKGHKVLTFDGWKRVEEDLRLGDKVASLRQTFELGQDKPEEIAAKFLAHLLMEGGTSTHDVRYTNADAAVVQDFTECANALGFDVVPISDDDYSYRVNGSRPSGIQYVGRISTVKEWCDKSDLMGKRATEKEIPEWLFRQPNEILWKFIDVCMATDGWFAMEAGNAGITLANEKLIDGINRIFKRLGIVASKIYRDNDFAGAWALQFGNESIELLLKNCSLYHKRHKAQEILEKERYSLIDTYPSDIYEQSSVSRYWYYKRGCSPYTKEYSVTRKKIQKLLDMRENEVWRRYEDADVFWDEIVAIELDGTYQTYDLETEKNHNFFVDGLCIHNSTLTKALILHDFLFNDYKWENGGLVKTQSRPLFYGWVADRHKKSVQNVDYVKMNIENNPKILRYFGKQAGRKWTEEDIILKNDCTLLSRSNASSLRGETKGGVHGTERYHRIILDDIENEDNTISEASREKIKRTVQNAVYPSLDPDIGRLIFNGTPVHHDALCQNILDGYRKAVEEKKENEYSWHVITYAATQPDMPGGVLWPDYWPRKKLDRKKQFYIDNNNLAGYYQEYELQVQSDEDRIWSEKHLQYHKGYYHFDKEEDQSYIVISGNRYPIHTFIGCDPATDIQSRTSDYSVILVVGVDAENNVYVLDYVRKQSIPTKGIRGQDGEIVGKHGVVDYILEMYEKYHCQSATVEDVAMTRSVFQDLEAEYRRRNRWDYAIISEKPGGREKRNKIHSILNNRFAARSVYIMEGMSELKYEIINFGEKLGHDDTIESLAFACKNAYPPNLKKSKLHDSYEQKFKPEARPWVAA